MFAVFPDVPREILFSLKARYGAMKRRCRDEHNHDYKWYGARGIECRFESLHEFIEYVLTLPGARDLTLEIDRKDNDGHYERGNLRFATHQENCNNKRHRWWQELRKQKAL